jgi:hypothetical protein
LNKYFVSIKVDREERPDIDRLYIAYVESTTGSAGSPANLFLTRNGAKAARHGVARMLGPVFAFPTPAWQRGFLRPALLQGTFPRTKPTPSPDAE